MERCSTSFLKEMQIKTTREYHLAAIRRVILKEKNKQKITSAEEPLHIAGGTAEWCSSYGKQFLKKK